MPSVAVDRFRDLSSALRKLKRLCEKSGLIKAAKDGRYFEKRSDLKRRQKAAAVRRGAKNRQKEREKLRRSIG